MARRPDAGFVERDFHRFLVAKQSRVLDAETGHAEMLPQFGREHDARLPEAFDAIDLMAAQPLREFADYAFAVPQRRDLDVLGQ